MDDHTSAFLTGSRKKLTGKKKKKVGTEGREEIYRQQTGK